MVVMNKQPIQISIDIKNLSSLTFSFYLYLLPIHPEWKKEKPIVLLHTLVSREFTLPHKLVETVRN